MARLLRLPAESVYSKALTLYVGLSLLLGTAVVLLTGSIILGEFEETERQEMEATLQRFTIVLSRETRPIEISLTEWLGTGGPDGKETLPGPDFLANQQLDFFAVARDGQVGNTAYRSDPVRRVLGDSNDWISVIKTSSPRSQRSGFVLVGDRLVVIAWQSLSDGRVAVAGRLFNDEMVSFLEGMFAARVQFEPLGTIVVGANAPNPIVSLLAQNESVSQPIGPNEITGYVLVRGINGTPIGHIQLRQARPLYREGVQAVQVFLIVLTLAGGALFLLIWVLLDWTILKRIRELTRKVEAEKDKGQLPLELRFDGIDELAHLATRIEELAAQVERAQWNYRAVVEDQTEIISRFTPGFAVTFSNGVFQKLFPHDPARGVFLRECLPPAAFDLLAAKFSALSPANAVATFVQQIARAGEAGVWFRSTLRASFAGDNSCQGGQWVAADITPQVEAQQRLQESERQLRSLSTHLLRLQDEERRKIARELHDSTAQSLSALEMNMSLLEPVMGDSNMQRIVAETRQIARDCCMELRNISYLLHPPLLDEVGLPFAFEWFADGFKKRTGIDVSVDLMANFPRLDSDVETTLFRVVQEAMSNIYRHSGASRAWLTLAIRDEAIQLEIRDNGSGLAKASGNSEGVGFAGMRERLAQLYGRLEVRSSPYGVSLSVKIDLATAHVRTNDSDPAR